MNILDQKLISRRKANSSVGTLNYFSYLGGTFRF